ncbi:MAG: HAD-IA family hydrolase [Myxococcota bacterium]
MELKAVFVDAAGTLLRPREPVGVTYARLARAHGHDADPVEVQQRFRAALASAREARQDDDGRRFWRAVVAESVGVDDERLFEALYLWYARPRAWWVDVEALAVLGAAARRGVRLGIVSNWDLRLRELYTRFALDRMFPVLACSAELGVEKPDPEIFRIACRVAGVRPRDAVHVGDDPEKDVEGAAGAGLTAILFDEDEGWTGIGRQLDALQRMPFFGR